VLEELEGVVLSDPLLLVLPEPLVVSVPAAPRYRFSVLQPARSAANATKRNAFFI